MRVVRLEIDAARAPHAPPNVVIGIGDRTSLSGVDQWRGALDRIADHVSVDWIHLKFMLVDPLSNNPMAVTDRRTRLYFAQSDPHAASTI